MQQQHDVLTKKLKQAIEARAVVENARKLQVDVLSNFAAKLSLSCKGLDIEMDNRLAKFRNALHKGVDFEHFAPLIDEIVILLKSQESKQITQQRDLHNSVLEAGKQLQKSKGIPDGARRTLRHLLDHELNNVQSTHDFIPLLTKLVNIYHQVLQVKLTLSSSKQADAQPELAKQLLALANDLVLEDEATEQIKSIKNNITCTDNVDDLLSSAIEIITVIASNISKERQSAQSFLVSLNQTLEELHHSILSTSKHSESISLEYSSLNKRIETKIKNLNTQTQAASSIAELKALVDDELKSLSEDLIEKERLERADREALITSFDEINKRIGSLESKLTKYKKRLNEQRFKSLLDGLTKLPNRAAFDERFHHEFHLFDLQESDVTLVVIDVDHFKSINDKYGHSAGDKTLLVIAKALQKSIRSSDFIARYGGEEFVLLMPGLALQNATLPLEKLRKAIKAIPFKFKDTQVQITISLGATQFKKGDTPLAAFDRADDALYNAKNGGRDKLCITP
ncbi:diguanylate cyclase [Pseudoalteromonas mariniglutinosa]|uniref:GGDEF domain-containing protein n=1 Tax=Pseudoalteromonas mariniglutinosa TaxID=206042 RepID=UPI00384E0DFE